MALHSTPELHDADPPEKWQVEKVADRCWHLTSSLGYTIASYPAKKAAEADKVTGFYVNLYEKEGRWFRGEPVATWRPYADVAAERQRNAERNAERLGARHGAAGTRPFGTLAGDSEALLMDALRQPGPATLANHDGRQRMASAYVTAWEQAAGRAYGDGPARPGRGAAGEDRQGSDNAACAAGHRQARRTGEH